MAQGNILTHPSSRGEASSFFHVFLKHLSDSASFLFSLVIIFILFVGWRLRSYHLITAEHGVGYALGVIGVLMMLALLIYPLRKRYPSLRFLGGVKMWFRVHMVLGILGPVCILFHANFQLGSLNSNVALFSMLIVATSGLIGRYIYTKIHYGLYGQRATLLELQKNFGLQKDELSPQFALVPGVQEILFPFAQELLTPSGSLSLSIRRVLSTGWRARLLRWNIRGIVHAYLRQHTRDHKWSWSRQRGMQRQMQRKVSQFLTQTARVSQFGFYERLFSLWHVLHLPLACVMAVAVVIHVIAVHLY
ncbi:MAG: hypothetical protein HZA28_05550 [Candidatus Omnitrophica bacterium]|nr:hypothetical protein [Candidatus Omnitrophota bacterium]